MSETRIRQLMQELIKELETTDEVTDDTVQIARQLETDIEDFVKSESRLSDSTVMDDAVALEASFAARHPMAERIIRELINNLSRIGI